MKYGICEWSLPVSGTLAIQLAGEMGFDGMQIGEAGGRKAGYPLNNKRVQELYLEAAKEGNIELHSLNLGALLADGTLNYAPETSEGMKAQESLRKGFEVCKALDIHTVVITVDAKNEEETCNVLKHLAYAYELAENAGVTIAMESALELPYIVSILDCMQDKVKVCMDILNPLRFGTGDPQEQICVFGEKHIDHFHLKDSTKDLFAPGQRGCTLLGEGDGRFAESMELVHKMGFDGWLITENYYNLPPMNEGDKDFFDLAKQDLATMKKYNKNV